MSVKTTAFSKQLEGIRHKLNLVKKKDSTFKVFGAASHKYHFDPPASLSYVEIFEKHHGIQLPEAYKAFVLHIGNGGISYQNSGAGPYYGIYPLGACLDQLVPENPETFLRKECCLHPGIGELQWEKLTQILDADDTQDNLYDEELENLYSGILPLGFQGCSYVHGLVLNGAHKGKIVNVDMATIERPVFSMDANFLDWYERWLDGILSSDPATKATSWFK